jgi:hypothetical protein
MARVREAPRRRFPSEILTTCPNAGIRRASAGFAALASVWVVGARKFAPGAKTVPHNVAFVGLGTGLLWFGWFGFNAGSAHAANRVAAQAFVNTDIAASVAMCTWTTISWWRSGKPSIIGAFTEAVAGLACITPCAECVPTWASFIIGFLAGAHLLRSGRLPHAHEVGRCSRRVGRPWCRRAARLHPSTSPGLDTEMEERAAHELA